MPNELKHFLHALLSDANLHARWINTFSYLEYIGFRKIVKSQDAADITSEVLAHAVEEGRHALRLKRYALKLGGATLERYTDDTLLCREAAEGYFQGLDAAVSSEFPDNRRLPYLYVTWLVEIRALSVYTEYEDANPNRADSPFRGILAEEENHLSTVERDLQTMDPLFATRVQTFRQIEERLYQNYLRALQQQLTGERHEQALAF